MTARQAIQLALSDNDPIYYVEHKTTECSTWFRLFVFPTVNGLVKMINLTDLIKNDDESDILELLMYDDEEKSLTFSHSVQETVETKINIIKDQIYHAGLLGRLRRSHQAKEDLQLKTL